MQPYRFAKPVMRPEELGVYGPDPRREERDGMIIERDVTVPLRDGTRIYADVFRPADGPPVPALLAWTPYGKHEGTLRYLARAFPEAGVREEDVSDLAAFEGPDPAFWVPRGYAVVNVNPRGLWYSEGVATFHSEQDAWDCYDTIEWIARQPWCSGKVGMTGVSALACAQWSVATLDPPHLAAINPWEGFTDFYREVGFHGGIPETFFRPYWAYGRVSVGLNAIEDLFNEQQEHPLFDEFWAAKVPQLERIRVPAYVVASWGDHGLHTRGTLEGFKRISSSQKWLEIHGDKKWAYYYAKHSLENQLAFFDHFLKGKETAVTSWPRVRAFVREHGREGTWRHFEGWPVPETRYRRLYLDPAGGQLVESPLAEVSSQWYLATSGGYDRKRRPLGRVQMEYTFDRDTDVVGYMRLRVWMAALDADDMDVFVGVQKVGSDGQLVPFIHYAQNEDGPVALGWLRASHRELDEVRSTEGQPVHKHQRELKVKPGEIVPLDIEIWPSGTRFRKGERLRLIIQGRDIQEYPPSRVYFRHEATVNRGRHVVYGGGPYESYLVIPTLP